MSEQLTREQLTREQPSSGHPTPGQSAPQPKEVRLERLRPAQIRAALDRAPVAWVPLGALEYHADHVPNGTDGITSEGLLIATAGQAGGVVLPWSYVTFGTLALPWSFRYDAKLVAETLRQTLRQLPDNGVRLAVVHTGHAPLDLIHLIKRVRTEIEAEMMSVAQGSHRLDIRLELAGVSMSHDSRSIDFA